MPSLFSRIVKGEIPAHQVAESDRFLAFLDINPLATGHTLVIPKQETDYLFDLDDETYAGLMAFCKQVAAAIERTVPCKRIGVAVIGLEVPHAHVHLIPINKVSDMNFANPKLKLTAEELAAVASTIRSNFNDGLMKKT